MRGGLCESVGALVAPGLLVLALDSGIGPGDDTGFFGRLFRLGGNSSSSSLIIESGVRDQPVGPARQSRTAPSPYGDHRVRRAPSFPPATTSSRAPARLRPADRSRTDPSTPDVSGSGEFHHACRPARASAVP